MEATTFAFSVTSELVKTIVITPPACYPAMDDVARRKTSLRDLPLDQESFAKAGFFYKGSGLTCYYCGLNIKTWKGDPWVIHALKYTSCPVLQLTRGLEFVNRVRAKKTPTYEEPSRATNLNCKICLENPSNILYLPCRHLASCGECKLKVDSCPVCRTKVAAVIRVFLC